MVLVDSDLRLVESAHAVNNVGSLGGAMTDIVTSENPGSLWDEIENSELSSSVVGEYEVRCIYVRNYSLNNETMQQVQVWIEQNTAAPFTDIDIGIGTAQVGDEEQTVANEDTLPLNVGWTFARGEENAEFLGNIAGGQGKSLWIRRHAGPTKSGSSYPSDNYILRFKFLKTGALSPGPGPGPPPGPDPGLDPFGIRMIYQTQTSGNVSMPFFMNMNDPYSDCRFNTTTGSVATKNGDGSWGLGPSPRIRLYSSLPGCARDIYDVPLDTYDHDIWGQREYMKAPNDWKNVEITGYFKVVSVDPANTSERKLYLYSRTFRHNTGVAGGCSGTAYKGVIYGFDQVLKFHKEAFHDGSQPCGDRNIVTVKEGIPRTDNNSWFGFKVMMWNYPDPARPNVDFVHLEMWTDLSNTNTWIKMAEKDDTGGWYPGMPSTTCPGDENCGGHQDQIIKWGGPTTEIRWDAGYTSVHFKNLSCREIIPSIMVLPPPSPPPPGPPPAPPPPPPGPGADVFGITQIYASKPGGSSYAATSWDANNRTFGNTSNCQVDPFDSRVQVSDAGDPKIDIIGNGTMKAGAITGNSGSPRVRVSGTWQNVESTVYVRATTPNMVCNFDLRTKTDHYCPGSETLFGGYIVNVAFDTQIVGFRKEKTHEIGYSSRLGEVSVTLNANTWYGFKAISYNVDSGVKLEAYMDITDGDSGGNWIKISEAADTGTWFQPVDQQSCAGSAIRTNHNLINGFLEYKRWSVREVDPSIVTLPPPPPGPPPPPTPPPSPPPPGPSPPPTPPPPPAEGPDPFGIAKLNNTKSGGKTWYSTSFSTSPARSYIGPPDKQGLDTYDNQLYFVLIGDSQAVISGGEIEVDGGSPRFFIEGPWTNTEMTCYVKFSFAGAHGSMYCHMGARVNHEVKDQNNRRCGWGRYVAKFDHGRDSGPATACDKEILHDIHGPEHDAHGFSGFNNTTWVGIKQVTRTMTSTGRVKVEAWVDTTGGTGGGNWVKNSEWIDDGSDEPLTAGKQQFIDDCMVTNDICTPLKLNCSGSLDEANLKQVWLRASRHSYWRTQNPEKTRYKWVSVREIDPLS